LWGVLCVMICCAPIVFLFYSIGKPNLALPALLSGAVVVIAAVAKWNLRRAAWFWITMGVFAALHALLVMWVHWGSQWVPVAFIVPIGIVDLFVMVWIVERLEKRLSPS